MLRISLLDWRRSGAFVAGQVDQRMSPEVRVPVYVANYRRAAVPGKPDVRDRSSGMVSNMGTFHSVALRHAGIVHAELNQPSAAHCRLPTHGGAPLSL